MSRPLFCVHELLAFELGSPPGPTFAHRVNFTPLLNDLEFGDAEQQNAALAKFLSLLCEEEAFTSTHVPPHAPALFRILHVLAREPLMEEQSALKTSLLQFICSLFTLDHESSRAHLDTLLAFFVQGDSVDRYYILDALEQLAAATDDPASRAAMTASVKSHLYNGADGDAARFAGVEALENALLCGREHCTKLFFDAGAYACVLSALTTPAPDEKLRIAALSCLAHVYAHVQSGGTAPADDDDPALTLTTTTAAITRAAMRCLRDVSADVVLAATGFLHATAEEAEVRAEFADDPAALCALVVALAGKPEGTVGTGPDWLLAKLGEGGGAGDVLLRGAFEALWTAGDADVDVGVKLQVLRALKDTFLDIRVAAFRAGASELILQTLKSDVQRRTSLLVDLDKLMEEEQVIGYFLLQAGSIPVLVDIADDASPTDRPLVLSVLARLLDSYSTGPDDRISQRDTVAAALMDAPTLARIISHLYSQHAATAGASAHLLAEILLEEAGTECWSYDSSSGGKAPPTPFKDTLVTPDLATHTLNLIHAQIAPAPALHLLCQLCWGYARGFSIVQKALAPFIPGADVFFFAALDGEYSGRHAARQRCCIAEAALLAGALPRAFDLLVVEETSDMARRQAAVEGLRVVLCADSADLGLARRNEVLPRLLASLVADRTRASLERVVWMLRLLESEEDQSWLLKWTDLGNENTTEHLLELMHQFPYKTDDDPEDDAKVRQTQKACEE
ncbi:hypothetical protein H0H81_011011 [Sphagnurus paluster]|uniref:Uncharacterized protein n=1 Tax=Sphagnurus paluster TaxID=117069 RepID=A0A9P7GP05_9AGAR|nr:hypothetical protein H0H81_011011 [Sphagnurus paluster]